MTRSRPDIAFTRAQVAVFVDGCFWHGCPEHQSIPGHNREWWVKKLKANQERDRRHDEELQAGGWKVVRVWEHEDPSSAADRVSSEVRNQSGGSPKT